jgi:hypothetical protein
MDRSPSHPHTEVVDFAAVPRGRPSPKIAITVDPDVYEGILAAATEADMSVSAWMTAAAREALLVENGLRAVAEYEKKYGAFTEAEMEAAHRRVAADRAACGRQASA